MPEHCLPPPQSAQLPAKQPRRPGVSEMGEIEPVMPRRFKSDHDLLQSLPELYMDASVKMEIQTVKGVKNALFGGEGALMHCRTCLANAQT